MREIPRGATLHTYDGGYQRLASGLYVPPTCAARPRPKALDLFCGAGGFSLGMEMGGFDVVAACENDATATITYLTNLGAYPCQMYWLDDTAEERMERALKKMMGLDRRKGARRAGEEEPPEPSRTPVRQRRRAGADLARSTLLLVAGEEDIGLLLGAEAEAAASAVQPDPHPPGARGEPLLGAGPLHAAHDQGLRLISSRIRCVCRRSMSESGRSGGGGRAGPRRRGRAGAGRSAGASSSSRRSASSARGWAIARSSCAARRC